MKLALEVFFGHSTFHTHQFEFQQTFDYSGLEGRLLSSSYAPQSSDARYEPMLRELHRIFDEHKIDGTVSFDYDTRVYYANL